MKTIDIIGKDYDGTWTKTRLACRGIVIEKGKLLLSHERVSGLWMIPGGGLENGEDERECCSREVCEETGAVVETGEGYLELIEYYKDRKWVNRYFLCSLKGYARQNLTEREAKAEMVPEWLALEEAEAIFASHTEYEGVDELRRELYLRDYIAITELKKLL